MAEQLQLKPMEVTPDMSDEKADVIGVLAFGFEMNKRLQEKRETGHVKYQNWHTSNRGYNSPTKLHQWLQTCLDKKRYVDVANLAMMLFHKEKMKDNK